ncbi:hypothetical protein PoB_003545300 [Plakobranchus ocellatus]|uniref:Protein CUSTOS n=1 Tax=Plakobranchus ocellatus TaxID=259542 RepID=A0AAV4ANN1_9GAST|nr:hypothetical protein PoB_003545300 [Plakobranchus ocellatus]
MSSTSESSDDDEEQRKISEAVLGIDTSLFQNKKTDCGKAPGDLSITGNDLHTTRQELFHSKRKDGVDVTNLKSNRPQDNNDDDVEPLLQTTPEFRSYVAKQLSKLLDRDLSECLEQSAWEQHIKGSMKSTGGIRLFTHSKPIQLSTLTMKNSEKSQTKLKPRKRKIRLSSSSDSSEDEAIKACVFSVADIEQENQQLARLEVKPPEETTTTRFPVTNSLTTQSQAGICTFEKHIEQSDLKEKTNGEIRGKRKKKKEKKKKERSSNKCEEECLV